MIKEHFRMLHEVVKRNHQFLGHIIPSMSSAQQTIQSDSSTAKERMGAAGADILHRVNGLIAEIKNLNADVAAFNKAVKQTEGNNYVYVPRDTSLVSS